MLITSPEFTRNLTGKTYYTKSFEPLDCSTKNVIYGIECTLCGLLYVGETQISHSFDVIIATVRHCSA
jgi:hypothetical protein